jgi:dolichol-phosphate mannosyltransferase
VVDDSSPDGTAEVAEAMGREVGGVEVLRRPEKSGLGSAYRAGFRLGLERGYDVLMEMDADLSHDPDQLPSLIAAAAAADLVIGSRYVPGGGVRDWGRVRRFVSRGGCWYARTVLGVPIRDLTGGFKCFRREALEAIDLDSVRSEGYAFQVELTYRAIGEGLRVVELPIVFADRRVGRSKMSRRIVLEAGWMVPRLRLAARRSRGRGSQARSGADRRV